MFRYLHYGVFAGADFRLSQMLVSHCSSPTVVALGCWRGCWLPVLSSVVQSSEEHSVIAGRGWVSPRPHVRFFLSWISFSFPLEACRRGRGPSTA